MLITNRAVGIIMFQVLIRFTLATGFRGPSGWFKQFKYV